MNFSKNNLSKISELEKKSMSKIKGGDPHNCGICETCENLGPQEKRSTAQGLAKDHGTILGIE